MAASQTQPSVNHYDVELCPVSHTRELGNGHSPIFSSENKLVPLTATPSCLANH